MKSDEKSKYFVAKKVTLTLPTVVVWRSNYEVFLGGKVWSLSETYLQTQTFSSVWNYSSTEREGHYWEKNKLNSWENFEKD